MHIPSKIMFLKLLSAALLFPTLNHCLDEKLTVVINEINLNDPFHLKRNEFIELFAYKKEADGTMTPAPRQSLQRFVLIGFRIQADAKTEAHKTPIITMVVDLWNERSNVDGYFVIGGLNVNGAQLTTTSNIVHFTNKFIHEQSTGVHRQSTLFGFMTKPKELEHFHYVNAIAVLLCENRAMIDSLRLSQRDTSKFLTGPLETIVKNTVIDMVIYRDNEAFRACSTIEKLYPAFKNMEYILREYGDTVDTDRSLNRYF